MASDQYQAGLKCRTEVLGPEYVEKALAGADDFNRDFQEMVTEYCWGGTWGRGVLDKRARSILNLGMLAGLAKSQEFKLHFRGAINNGLTLDELREILIQISVYCGIPAGIEAYRNAREVLADMDIDPSNMDSDKS
ncbi:MAG: 4-carboxymuconolactone decarboxylase [Rhodospirillaceae bacterium]|jgi:4-carboxymuconolactone decarboxylase|nr:4-carboxymuconolactone decarboxylase [Rhodospirillaceae bacterium]MBT3911367.1 4-carboxymuconolactone decarboxylase [Rhodospirillaceae bacterium]MBT5299484.1 4-carboxymuconolactone decarboxylase [Rhodospirillaceae bacterium]MBT6084695.1 4-carboxymuconolactone decarboxylase [Rhodospirillaceae bacterium]MBT6607563.1 4-carboxymuconolactone decarboxylase [Rhodospirillaceae bacterium]